MCTHSIETINFLIEFTGVVGVYPRVDNYHVPKNWPQHWNDESVVVFDSFERSSGCRYFAILDYDEFFIPSRYRTLREMFVSIILIY